MLGNGLPTKSTIPESRPRGASQLNNLSYVDDMCLLVIVSAFIPGGLKRNHQSSLPLHGRRHSRLALSRDLRPVISSSCVAEDSHSRPAVIIIALVFNWSPVRLRYMRGSVAKTRSLISSPPDVFQCDPTSGAFFRRAY